MPATTSSISRVHCVNRVAVPGGDIVVKTVDEMIALIAELLAARLETERRFLAATVAFDTAFANTFILVIGFSPVLYSNLEY